MEIIKAIKQDSPLLGIVLGLLGPALGFFVFYLLKFFPLGQSLAVYFNLLKDNSYLIPKILSLCLLVNGITFFFYTQYKKDQTSQGILIATLAYAIAIIILKLI